MSPLQTRPEDIADFLVDLAIAANTINRHISSPFLPASSGDLELDLEEVGSDASLETLSFDTH